MSGLDLFLTLFVYLYIGMLVAIIYDSGCIVIYMGTDMIQWQLLIAAVVFAILGVIEKKKSK